MEHVENKQWAYSMEDNGYAMLEEFNADVFGVELDRCPADHTCDASGVTSIGEYVNFEIKIRKMKLLDDNLSISSTTNDGRSYKCNDLYLESHKCGDLLLDYVCDGIEPIYINFLEDNTVVVYNVRKLNSRPKKVCKKIYSKLYDTMELSKRETLPLSDAWIYRKIKGKYKLIRKPICQN